MQQGQPTLRGSAGNGVLSPVRKTGLHENSSKFLRPPGNNQDNWKRSYSFFEPASSLLWSGRFQDKLVALLVNLSRTADLIARLLGQRAQLEPHQYYMTILLSPRLSWQNQD